MLDLKGFTDLFGLRFRVGKFKSALALPFTNITVKVLWVLVSNVFFPKLVRVVVPLDGGQPLYRPPNTL